MDTERRRPPHARGEGGRKIWMPVVLLLCVGGCATSRVPEPIRDHALTSPTVSEVQQRPETFLGQRVRWGGTILDVRNERNATAIEILAKPLERDGKPNQDAAGLGRFIVELAGFKDPTEFPKERRFTVVGPLGGIQTRDVGEYPYPYPLVKGDVWHLWPKPPPVYPESMFYGPWYRPWYGPGFGPYGPWYGPW